MAPKYKLIYFNFTGRAEPIRYIFAYAGQEYEDSRLSRDQWLQVKPNTPFGKLPVLEIDGKLVSQSNAIARYLAKQFGLLGKSDLENLQADSLIDALEDYSSLQMRLFREENQERVAEIKKDQASFLEKFDKIVAGNASGFLVGSQITWADLAFAANFSDKLARDPELLKPYPALGGLVQKVNSLPKIKAWLEKRPKSDAPRGPPPKRS